MKFHSMLFDLDGTLVDTAPDLIAALNYVLTSHSQPQVDYLKAKQCISKGSKELVRFGFGIQDNHPQFLQYNQELLTYYEQNIAVHSKLFDGMDRVIDKLDTWGIVTNKSTKLTHLLLNELHIKPNVVVCGDTLTENKPSGLPITYAMKELGVKKTIMIGDDIVDYRSAQNAGIPSIIVDWGYSQVCEYEYLIHNTMELEQWIA